MKIINIILAVSALMFSSVTYATWIDWSSTTTGTLNLGGNVVNVSLTGNPWDLHNGDYYYNNGSTGGTSPSGTYAGLAPSDVIRVNQAGRYTLTFDQAVSDLDMALVSVGRGNLPVTYDFDDAFTVLSSGPNYWGYTGYTTSGNDFTGYEYNGILEFSGSFNSISFTVTNPEHWHGFNFGAASVSSVPEPSVLTLMGLGLLGFGVARKRTKK
ncbi:MAG: PEP-CTERM sorting domain-containing protein [Gammaproteobacteria bacterium]|nr:PEP-CTERM sorting domain-containing protein [Gammaproteobacteria bacterium]